MANTDGRATGIHDVASGKLLANRWRVLDIVGGGGMGVVYRCWDLNLRTVVAVKILNQEFQDDRRIVERFHREVEVLIKSAHPNIAVIHACSSREEEPPVFLVMEFLDGPTLKMLLDETPSRQLHPQRIRRIGIQVLDALDAVHERGIIHRDLKPENIFILRTGTGRRNIDVTKVIDFGIAKASESQGGGTSASLTQVGTVVGTPYYMSPEQCLGAPNVDHRADLYAVGVMLYEMATGRLPFDTPNREEVMIGHISTKPVPPREINPEISPELEEVILRAMTKKAQFRFPNAGEMNEALEDAIPEDKNYYRDSQQVSPVEGRVSALALHAEIPEMPSSPPPDVSNTPTNLLRSAEPAVRDIVLAKTITPTDLGAEARAVAEAATAPASDEDRSPPAVVSTPDITLPPIIGGTPARNLDQGERAPFDAAVAYLKQCGIWIGKVPRKIQLYALAGIAGLFLTSLTITLAVRGCDGSKTVADVGEITETTVAETEEDVFISPAEQPDVIVVRFPAPPLSPAPADAETAAEKETAEVIPAEEVDYASEVSLPETPEVLPEATPAEPPDGYAELIDRARRARNWRAATTKLEEAIQLWPDGPDAWEALGDVLVTARDQTERARAAYTRCLELLTADALSRRARLEGKIRGLR